MGRTVAELQSVMSSTEFTYWARFYQLEPFGYEIENYRMGAIASAVVNVTRRKKSDMVKPADFYPQQKRRKQLTQRQIEQLEKKRGKRRNGNG